MRIIMLGDVVGRSGREAVLSHLQTLRGRADFIVLNGENAAHGFGITRKMCRDFFDAGVDVITLGNHTWDKREIIDWIDSEPRVLRPVNYPTGTPGRGWGIYTTPAGGRVMVLQVMGRLFMDPLDDPFARVQDCLRDRPLKNATPTQLDAVLVDIHAEATSEKVALAHMLDGRVSAVVGTHTHVPTADGRVLEHGTAFQSDLGMCGDYDSVIGMCKESALARFTTKVAPPRLEPADGVGAVCGVFIQTDEKTGLARTIAPVRLGAGLPVAPLP